MKEHRVGIIMNGVTGRMGTNQHLIRSVLEIREQGGVILGPDERIMPEPLLAGRNGAKLQHLSETCGGLPFTTDLEGALADPNYEVYFDAQVTERRAGAVRKATSAGKHIYCEKPTATTFKEALELYRLAQRSNVKHGVVQDKLWLPGIRKLKHLLDTGFFGEILSVRGEFGYWVFTGRDGLAQRPSWNYRKKDGGGIIADMLCHWRYLVDNLFGDISSLVCLGATHIKERWDEAGAPYTCTADDAAYATFITNRGVICQFNSSWCTRVKREDLLTLHVDGTDGSALAGLRECWTQHNANTPKPVWNPDIDSPIDYQGGWTRVPTNRDYDNAFKEQWELFLRHVVCGDPFPWDLKEGAKGVQLAELGYVSSEERRWLDVPTV